MKVLVLICALLAAAGVVMAQDVLIHRTEGPLPGSAIGPDVRVMQFAGQHAAGVVEVISHGEGMVASVVKNAPYSAESITEHVQKLADGATIKRSNKTLLYRDSEGRTRREVSFEGIGPWAPAGGPKTNITIHDPVAKEMLILDAEAKTIRRIKLPDGPGAGHTMHWVQADVKATEPGKREERRFEIRVASPEEVSAVGHKQAGPARPAPQIEQLGTRTVEGLVAEGTRVTFTIPEGSIGNDRPLTTVTERWFSPELQLEVLRTNKDPRMGESTTRLMNVSRAEPPATLFQAPPDYQVVQEDVMGHHTGREVVIEKK